jgi:hypothetical protein
MKRRRKYIIKTEEAVGCGDANWTELQSHRSWSFFGVDGETENTLKVLSSGI